MAQCRARVIQRDGSPYCRVHGFEARGIEKDGHTRCGARTTTLRQSEPTGAKQECPTCSDAGYICLQKKGTLVKVTCPECRGLTPSHLGGGGKRK